MSSEKYTQLGLHHFAMNGKLPYPGSEWSTRSYETTIKVSHKYYSSNWIKNIGFRTGLQPNGAYVIGLDFDITNRTETFDVKNRCVVPTSTCMKTKSLFNFITTVFGMDGVFESSTCGNYGMLLDISDHPELVLFMTKKNKKKYNINNLEILNGYAMTLPPSSTNCKKHKKVCKSRKFVKCPAIQKADKQLVKMLIGYLEHQGYYRTEKAYQLIQKNVNKDYKDFDPIHLSPTTKQIQIIQLILDTLPTKHADEYDLWRNIGVALRSYSNSEAMFNVFVEFSKRSTKFESSNPCMTIWKCCKMSINFYYLTNLFKKHNVDPTKTISFNTLYRSQHINILKGINDVKGIKLKRINNKYITSTTGKIELFNYFRQKDIKTINNKMAIVKSHTGSGKTTAMKEIVNRCKKEGIVVKSICSRRVLAKFHSGELMLKYYEDIHMFHDSTNDHLACQLDSLHKLGDGLADTRYVLLMDEINSLIIHLRNGLSTMSNQRATMLKLLQNVINGAMFVFAVDADVMTPTIEYLRSISNKEITLYVNDYKLENKCDVIVEKEKTVMIQKIINDITLNKPIFVCSDSFKKFKAQVVEPVRAEMKSRFTKKHTSLKLTEKQFIDQFRFYSSEDGDKDDFIDTKQFSKYFTFVTPTVLYGIDFNFEAPVYQFIFGGTIDSLSCCQQNARIRQPTEINCWFRNEHFYPKYRQIRDLKDDVKAGCTQVQNYLQMNVEYACGKKLIKSYTKFVIATSFLQFQLLDHRFHVLDILSNKGHAIKVSNIEVPKAKRIKSVPVVLPEVLNKILTGKPDDITTASSLAVYRKRMELLKLTDDHLSGKNGQLIVRFLVSDHDFSSVFAYFKLKGASIDSMLQYIKRTTEVNVHLMTSLKMKLVYMKQLQDSLGIKSLLKADYFNNMEELQSSDKTFEIDEKLKTAFRLRGKMYEAKRLSHTDTYMLFMRLCSSMLGCVMKTKRSQVNGTRVRCHYFDDSSRVLDVLYDIYTKQM
jgi:hypothetical protein